MKILLMTAIFCMMTNWINAGELIFIVNQKSPLIKEKTAECSKSDIRNIYIGKTQFCGRIKIMPVKRRNKEILNQFLKTFLNMTLSDYRDYWVKKTFKDGTTAPKVIEKAEDVIKHVSENEGGIGYLMDTELTGKEEGVLKLSIKF